MDEASVMEDLRRYLRGKSGSAAEAASPKELVWYPLMPFDENRKWLGFANDNKWYWSGERHGRTMLYPVTTEAAIGALPLLESPPHAVVSRLQEVTRRTSVTSDDLLAALPLARLIDVALETRSNYWISHAIDWAEMLGPDRLSTQLAAAAEDRQIDQRTRHRIRKLVSRQYYNRLNPWKPR
jgi:hypothetical protein